MKVIRENKDKGYRTVTLRLPEETMRKVDEVAEVNDLSRQKLIAAIIEQVMGDRSFVLKVE